jgi:hypothetical protein
VPAAFFASGLGAIALLAATFQVPASGPVQPGCALWAGDWYCCHVAVRHHQSGPLDQWFGELIYGVFLNHILLIWIVQATAAATQFAKTGLVLGTSIPLLILTFIVIERPLIPSGAH